MNEIFSTLSFLTEIAPEFDPEAGEINLFLSAMLMIAVIAVSVLVAIGLFVGIAFAAGSGTLLLLGVTISSSLTAAATNKTTGFVWFIIQISAFAGFISGASVGLIYSYLHKLPLLNLSYTGLLTALGLIGGALMGWALSRVWLNLWKRAVLWWKSRQNENPKPLS